MTGYFTKYFFVLNLLCGLIISGIPISVRAEVEFNDDQIRRYAGAATAIERKRDDVWRRAKAYEGWTNLKSKADAQGVTVCGLKKSEQPPVILSLCSELFEFSEQEIRRNGFSNNRDFNQITQAQQQNNQLQKRIQGAIIELSNPKK